MTQPTNRMLMRGALRIHEAIVRADLEAIPDLPLTAWQELQEIHGRLERTVKRSWIHAAAHARAEIEHSFSYLIRQLEECRRSLALHQEPTRLCSARDVHRELVAVQTEFDGVKLDLKARTLSVATDTIVLEQVYLGRFEVNLHWDRLDEDDTYDVIALDPHATAGDSSTTHPHVRDERLCEGDGRLPIQHALAQGRLCDFFVLVRQILETYNSSSAFVSLEHWSGTPCQDCGRMTGVDDSTSCECCEDNLCLDCYTNCQDCGRSCCSDCRSACTVCEQDFCVACLRRCLGCRGEFCSNCQSNGRCTVCQHKENKLHDQIDFAGDDQPSATRTAPHAAVQPLCLGQVVASA